MLADRQRPPPEILAELPVFAAQRGPLLPGVIIPRIASSDAERLTLDTARLGGGWLATSWSTAEDRPLPAILGLARIVHDRELPDGRRLLRLRGAGRLALRHELARDGALRRVEAGLLPEAPATPQTLAILQAQIERLAETLSPDDRYMVRAVLGVPEPVEIVYVVATVLATLLTTDQRDEIELLRRCLEADDGEARACLLLEISAQYSRALASEGRIPHHAVQ